MADLNNKEIRAALEAFRQKFPTPDRELAIDLLRKCGFRYKRSSDHSDIYKSPQFPGRPVTINKTTKLYEGYSRVIAHLAEEVLASLPDKLEEEGDQHGSES